MIWQHFAMGYHHDGTWAPGERTVEEEPASQAQATAGEEYPPWPEDRLAILALVPVAVKRQPLVVVKRLSFAAVAKTCSRCDAVVACRTMPQSSDPESLEPEVAQNTGCSQPFVAAEAAVDSGEGLRCSCWALPKKL